MVVANLTHTFRGSAVGEFASRLSRPLTSLGIATAFAVTFWCGSTSHAAQDVGPGPSSAAVATVSALAQQTTSPEGVFPAEGRYLFGEVSEPDQIGHGYMVLESNGETVYGALYYPHSSFDCFYGEVEGAELAMTIINSYTQEIYPYSIALVSDSAIAATSPGSLEPLSLEGFYALDQVSDNDIRMLDMCKAAVTADI